ncbi:helix-turn-helix domain-containing protein [Streptomyces sp. NPDC018059]|uniref:helix-turn-helix domain-containing protein n=1 Tax=Streptomyces sp. NPDC018059 TaxID=3365041 RepID=UPI0037A979BD
MQSRGEGLITKEDRTFPRTAQQLNAPSRARSHRSRNGVGHVNEHHPDQFTVVGNHLAQHPDLTLTAIGLATHIQSLPEGSPVGIKALAAKFPEGETRIAAALRELEAHGYLARIKERTPSGRIVTRTLSYNKPQPRPAAPPARRAPAPEPEEPEPAAPLPTRAPQPHPAADLLAGLRADDPRLLLTARDIHRLTPAVTAWLQRGVAPEAVRRVLTTALPDEPIRHPAAFLAHRLTEHLPPPLPTPRIGPPRPAPLQNCDQCDRAFRAPRPGRCHGCVSTSTRSPAGAAA